MALVLLVLQLGLDMTPADTDMFAIPDPNSLIQLPWNKEVGWLASDLWMGGKPVKASPRVMLKNQIKQLSKKNLKMKSGVECEYFLISQDGTKLLMKKIFNLNLVMINQL